MHFRQLAVFLLALASFGCTEKREQSASSSSSSSSSSPARSETSSALKRQAPFSLPADLTGFLLLWFDEAGVHSAKAVDEIPQSARKVVRVRPLDPEVEDKLDPLVVYVADLSVAPDEPTRPVVTMSRRDFDELVDRASGSTAQAELSRPVIVYRTSWCGVCERAVSWLRNNGHAYIEKDVESDAAAAQEVQQKLSAAGQRSRGVPVIDVGGQLMVGFDPDQLEQMLTGGDGP